MAQTICEKCDFYRKFFVCVSDDAPVTDYVDGSKSAGVINREGKCPYYKDQEPPPDKDKKSW